LCNTICVYGNINKAGNKYYILCKEILPVVVKKFYLPDKIILPVVNPLWKTTGKNFLPVVTKIIHPSEVELLDTHSNND